MDVLWAELRPYAPLVVAGVLVLLPPFWGLTRHVVTLVHEAGHAIVALLTGRKLMGIRLHSDTSGLTLSKGKPTGPGMIATSIAGYLAAPFVAVFIAILLTAELVQVLGWATLGLVVGMLLYIRNLFGAVMLAATGALLVWLDAHTPVDIRVQLFYIAAWVLIVGNVRTLADGWRSRSGRTDIDQLTWLTHLPRIIWLLILFGATLFAGLALWEMQGLGR